jgi:hypothetical protein
VQTSGIGIVILSESVADRPGQRTVIGIGVAGPGDENLGRTHTSEQFPDLIRKIAFVIAQLTVWETELETIPSRHGQDVESAMPFTLADLGDVLGFWPWRR